jgi:hypothetical protein
MRSAQIVPATYFSPLASWRRLSCLEQFTRTKTGETRKLLSPVDVYIIARLQYYRLHRTAMGVVCLFVRIPNLWHHLSHPCRSTVGTYFHCCGGFGCYIHPY